MEFLQKDTWHTIDGRRPYRIVLAIEPACGRGEDIASDSVNSEKKNSRPGMANYNNAPKEGDELVTAETARDLAVRKGVKLVGSRPLCDNRRGYKSGERISMSQAGMRRPGLSAREHSAT